MVLNKDFREFIELLNSNDVKYLVVGGYALALHGYPRYTKDIDIWLLISQENANKIIKTLLEFGFVSENISKEDFLKNDIIIQLGYPPNRIDLMTTCEGIDFEKCYEHKIQIEIEGLIINFIDFESLKLNKKKTGRLQDLADLENLENPKQD
jgi:hypothetical protein